MKFYTYLFLSIVFLASCDKETTTDPGPDPVEDFTVLGQDPSTSPMALSTDGVLFYDNLSYGSFDRNIFDIFTPDSDVPTPLVIYIHGGGFVQGDKAGDYGDSNFSAFVDGILSEDIAFVSINYRLLGFGETEGVLKSVNDSKRALQFIRHNADELNIDEDKIILMGGSAGAGTSLWIGLQDDLADPSNADEVLQESTRVSGIIAIETQSSYDVLEWHNSTFSEYQDDGLGFDELRAIVGDLTAIAFYGVSTYDDLFTPEITADRAALDMLSFISSDDPDMYVLNANIAYEVPVNTDQVLHHPLHAKALLDAATANNVSCLAVIAPMSINNTNGESITDFIVNRIGN